MTEGLLPPAWAEGDKATIDLKATLAQHAAWLADDPGGARADLQEADLRNADLHRVNLRDANLRWANLSGADLRGAYLIGADLAWANLRYADLRRVNLRDANLHYADLVEANLRAANLRGAILRDAHLHHADLRGADMRETNLRGADLSDAYGYVCAGWDQRGYHFFGVQHADGWRVSAACRWFTLAEAEAHWTKRGNEDALARVAIVRAAANASTSPPPWDFDDCPEQSA